MLVSYTNHLAKTMPSSPADNAIMTIGEVADFIKIMERTIYRLAGAKKIPSFKVGGALALLESGLDRWIQQQSAGALQKDGD